MTEFCNNIVKVAADPQRDSRVDLRRLLWQCYDKIHGKQQDRSIKKLTRFVYIQQQIVK